jgi:sugar (glycoside-pentoside-hexuronide) transporter
MAAYALGDHAVNVCLSSLSLVFFVFLVTVAGLQPWLAGVIAWIARLVDAVSDPLMGRLSDGTRWRAGRRRPFFLIGMVPLGIFFALMWTTPFVGQAEMFAWYLVVYVGLALSLTVVSVPYMSLIPEMSQDYDERTSLNSWRAGAAVMGTMVAASFFQIADALGGGATGFAHAGWLLAAWVVLPWPVVFAVSFEPRAAIRTERTGWLVALGSVARHRTYLRLCGIYLAGRIAMDLLGLAVPLFVVIWLGRPGDVTWVLLAMLVVVVASLPFWLRFARHREKHRVLAIGSVWLVICLVAVFFAEPAWPRWVMFAIAGVLGVGYAVVDLFPWAMLGEVIDEDELVTRERREGVYNGIFTFIRKVGGATAYMFGGFALSLAGYDSKAAEQPESAIWTIRVIATLLPAACVLAALVGIARYPLTRARHEEIRASIRAREEAAPATR